MLVANAAHSKAGTFNDIGNTDVQDIVNVNICHPIYTIKCLLNKLIQRYEETKVKPAIIVLSSVLAHDKPRKYVLTLGATKSFCNFLAQGLEYELRGRIDVISASPGWLATKMSGVINPDMSTISPERAADCIFRDVGLEPYSFGAFRHHLHMWQVWYFKPTLVMDYLFEKKL